MNDRQTHTLFDAITHVDDDLLEAAQSACAAKRRRVWPYLRWAAAAACVCLVAAAVLSPWCRGSAPTQRPGSTVNAPVAGDDHSKNPDEQHGAVMAPEGGDIHSAPILPMISAFGESTYSGDMSVSNGGRVNSPALEAAMEKYGDTVRYRVMIELFRDGTAIAAAGETARREVDRLVDAGYPVAFETYNDGFIEHHFFTLHATAEQLRGYPLDPSLGYCFLLYGEYLQELPPVDLPVYNGADSLP